MNYKILHLGVSSACIILAFFFGYLYALREQILTQENNNAIEYIDITTSTRNITIKNGPANIFFRVDGEIMQTGSIDLK
ncbi:hypothetical protein N9J72_01490 [Candidatus Gracilibacteria bacterium]|nr:hypothetical protein [Candidatus Gracilibacteria bacterium]